jgi:hypothetical protein
LKENDLATDALNCRYRENNWRTSENTSKSAKLLKDINEVKVIHTF